MISSSYNNNQPAVSGDLQRAHYKLCFSSGGRSGAEPSHPGQCGDRRDSLFQRGEWVFCRHHLFLWCARHSLKASVSNDIAEHIFCSTLILGIMMFDTER